MNDILIATILPNGISRTNGNCQFSLCIDVNTNLDPDSYTDAALLELMGMLSKAIDNMIGHGFKVKLGAADLNIEAAWIQLLGKPEDMAKLRSGIWQRLFDFRPAEELFADRGGMLNVRTHIMDLLGTSLISGPLQQLHENKITNSNNDLVFLSTADDLKKTYGKEVDEFFKRLQNIRSYSADRSTQQKNDYFNRRVASYFASPGRAIPDSKDQISKEKVFDTLSLLSENPIYQRLSGFTIDFIIDMKIEGTGFTIQFAPPDDIAGIKAAAWIAPASSIVIHKEINGNRRAILLEGKTKECSGIYNSSQLKAFNHDRISKIDSLKRIFDQLGNDPASRTAEQKEQLIDSVKKLDTSTMTKGMTLYHDKWGDEVNSGALVNGVVETALRSDMVLKEQNLIKGHRFGVSAGKTFLSLGKRKCTITWQDGLQKRELLADPIAMDFSVNTDTGMASIDEASGKVTLHVDETLLNWSGENLGFPTIFARKENEKNMEPTNEEGGVSDSLQVVMERLHTVFNEMHFPFNTSIRKTRVTYDGTAVNYAPPPEVSSLITLRFDPLPRSNARLVFGKSYNVVVVNEYKNGWALPFEEDNPFQLSIAAYVELVKNKCNFDLPSFEFKRNEPVAPVALFLKESLRAADGASQVPGKEGESLEHLVIRGQDGNATVQRSYRHFLPPMISFQHAFWHGEIFKMTPQQSFYWYGKYQSGNGIQMQDAISQDIATTSYIPDPLCIGFNIQFFLDRELKNEAPEYVLSDGTLIEHLFTRDRYPEVRGCLLTLEDDQGSTQRLVKTTNGITVRLRRGGELFAVIRTVLSGRYEKEMFIVGGTSHDMQQGKSVFVTPPKVIRLTHAAKRPLIKPEIMETYNIKRTPNSTQLSFEADIHFEQLNLYRATDGKYKYIDGTLPAADMELYAKWEEYVDDPTQILPDPSRPDWTPEKPMIILEKLNFILEMPIVLKEQQLIEMGNNLSRQGDDPNIAKNFSARIAISYDLRSTKYLEKKLIVKNKSSFTAYYPSNTPANVFEQVSETVKEVRVLNNKKPAKPSVNRVIPFIVNEDSQPRGVLTRKTAMNRFRIFLNRGRLTSGQGERLGVLVYERSSPYNQHFVTNDSLSITGRDITSDAYKPIVDNMENKRIHFYPSSLSAQDPRGLTENNNPVADLAQFKPKYEETLGLMTYLPRFDIEENLWYVDIEVDIDGPGNNSLHSPFFQLALVHYQQFSSVHVVGAAEPSMDCRISEVERSPFLYLLPKRTISLQLFPEKVRVGLSAEKESLAAPRASYSSVFVAAVQGSDDGVVWSTARASGSTGGNSGLGGGRESFALLPTQSGQQTEIAYVRQPGMSSYRVLVLELEVFDGYDPATASLFSDIVENRKCGVIMVNTFPIN